MKVLGVSALIVYSISAVEIDTNDSELSDEENEVRGNIFDFFNVGQVGWRTDDNGDTVPVCETGFSLPSNYARRNIKKNFKQAIDNNTNDLLDQIFQDAVIYGIDFCNCMLDRYIANLSFDPDEAAGMRSAPVIDWNCHDNECDIPVTLKGIWGYGCWCNFGPDLMKGKGTPVNPHDKVCQDMQLCLRCAEMDAEDGSYSCNVKTQQYNSLLALGVQGLADNDDSINSSCASLNAGSKCASHVCTCEIQMINDLLELVWSGYTHDITPRHPDNPYGGSFDWESECYIDPTGQIVKECCGKYPFRFPYNSLNKECCERGGDYQTYNPLDQVCCASGVKKVSNGGC